MPGCAKTKKDNDLKFNAMWILWTSLFVLGSATICWMVYEFKNPFIVPDDFDLDNYKEPELDEHEECFFSKN